MNLNFFTAEFPFKNAETFIENEIPIIAKSFEKINIFPHYFNNNKTHRIVPDNVNIIQLENEKLGALSFNYKVLIVKFFINEFFLTSKKKFYLKTYRLRLSELKQAAIKAQYIENNDLLLKNAVNYSFWMNEWALVLTFLKKRKVINNFIFRCGGYDIWDERHEGNYLPFRGVIYKYANNIYPNTKLGEVYIKNKKLYPHKVKHQYFGTKDFGFGKFNKDDDFTIVSISNVIPLKRVELIIDILKNVNRKVKWVHFGDGELLEEIKIKAQNNLKHHVVEFKGRLPKFEDVLKYYIDNTVHLFISTSETEGLPVTMQEAISFGVPIMATNVGGVSEIVNNTTGYLLDKNIDINAAANFINNFENSVYNTLKKRKEIRRFWEDNFNAEKVYLKFANELKQIAQ